MGRILSVDDNEDILMLIRRALEKDGHEVTSLQSAEGLEASDLSKYDLILLDIMMPGVDGLSFCKRIRDQVDCPVLFLTAKVLDEDLMEGFQAGGDDYIKKPFSIVELRARVNAHLRREKREVKSRMTVDDISLDLQGKELYCEDKPVNLTKSEYEICEFLIKNKGQVFSLEQIIEHVFGYDSESDISAIREHIKNIRNKIDKGDKKHIQTVWGIGYKWA